MKEPETLSHLVRSWVMPVHGMKRPPARIWLGAVPILLALVHLSLGARAEFRVPRLSGPVVDGADFLSEATERQLALALQEIKRQSGGTEIAVLTVENLGGLTIEQASIQVVDQWRLGSEDKDNGVLLFCSKQERRVRIEVGQGLEGQLTDAHSKRIIDETILPMFRAGHMDQGILLGVYHIAKRTNPDLDFEQIFGAQSQNWSRRSPEDGGFGWVIPLLFLLFVIFGGRGRGGMMGGFLTGMLLGSMGSRRSGGGGLSGGFGGGFGGGGGFSGGGASGGW